METYEGSSAIGDDIPPKPAQTEKGVPTGLIDSEEKNDEPYQEDEMAEFSSPIQDLNAHPAPMVAMGMGSGAGISLSAPQHTAKSGKPFGLTDEQFVALLAGVSGVLAFSKPVQSRLSTTIPKFMVDGDLSITGMAVTALVAALIFYFVRKNV